MLRKLIDKLFYGGYEAASARSAERVVPRYSRGSILLQLGRFRNWDQAAQLTADGDRAAARLEEGYRRYSR